MTDAQRDISRKLRVFDYAKETVNISKTCRYFGISRDTFYCWQHNYQRLGKQKTSITDETRRTS